MALQLPDGQSLEEARRELVAKIGENIGVRRFEYVRPTRQLAAYFHGTRIGVSGRCRGRRYGPGEGPGHAHCRQQSPLPVAG